jgi:hypothetical protein
VTKNTKNLAYDRTGNATPHLYIVNPLNAELNRICHLLALLAHLIFHISRIRVNYIPTTKLKISVHISQKYGDLKCL